MQRKNIVIITDRASVDLNTRSILYIDLKGRKTVVHLTGGRTCETYTPIERLEQELGDGFLRISRGCIVSKNAIHRMNEEGVELLNGETLRCTRRRRQALKEVCRTGRREMISGFDRSRTPNTPEEYIRYYAAFETLPVAFTDIEMIFNEEHRAVDWRFRYANDALAHLEKCSKEELLNNSFRTLFPNMDDKWLCAYERTALFGETLEIMDYSPEIDTYLKIISFPTFAGHCGCLLFDLSDIRPVQTSPSEIEVLKSYVSGLFPQP